MHDYKVGDRVTFGRPTGEQTLGEIVKLNPAKAKVRQLESRRAMRAGTLWTVPYHLMTKVSDTTVTAFPTLPTFVPKVHAMHKVGDTVHFTAKGRTIVGKVIRISAKTVAVLPNDALTPRSYWRVAPSFLKAGGPAGYIKPTPVDPKTKRPDADILKDICGIYSCLSPENLWMDGEATKAEANRRRARYNAELKALFTEFGRVVDESEAYDKSTLIRA